MAFLDSCAEWINSDVEWVFQTDQQFLFEETKEVILGSPFSQIKYFDTSPYGVPTDWEAAKVREGDRIWRMRFGKNN
jgi:tRNA G46 methylase TrmB